MLLDTKSPYWQRQVTADPFTLESLIAWLEMQPADGTYIYTSSRNCVLCQYFRDMGFCNPRISISLLCYDHGTVYFPKVFDRIANKDDQTFGDALQRARAALNIHKGGE